MSRGDDKRLRATIVLLVALVLECYWLKFRVVPSFARVYAEFEVLPTVTRLALGWVPYIVALALAPGPLILALRGADDGDRRKGIAAVVLGGVLVAGLGVFVVWALYQPVYELSEQVR